MKDKILKTIKKYKLIESGDKVLIAVSGGPDSMCLLDILNKLKEKLKIEIAVAHVNHGIRKEAGEETEYIKKYCEKYNIKIYIKYEDVTKLAKQEKIGLEEEGRKVRYAFFDEVLKETGFNKIAIAHNMNDKVETNTNSYIKVILSEINKLKQDITKLDENYTFEELDYSDFASGKEIIDYLDNLYIKYYKDYTILLNKKQKYEDYQSNMIPKIY